MRVVFDVNVLIAAVVTAPGTYTYPYFEQVPPASGHPPADCVSMLMDGDRFSAYLSEHILWNLRDKLPRLGWPNDATRDYLTFLTDIVADSTGAVVADPSRVSFDCPDFEDNLILDLVAAVDADILVTDDARDLLPMNPWRGHLILSSSDFIRQMLTRR